MSAQSAASQVRRWTARRFLLAGVGMGLGCLTVAYRRQPDRLAVITVIPAWCWLFAAVVLLVWLRRAANGWTWRLTLLVTLLFAGLCVEQTRSVPRGWFLARPTPEQATQVWRVVSLNCHVGTAAVVGDLETLQPDLVLLQESPVETALGIIAERLYGDRGAHVSTGDCSIVARGTLELIPSPPQSRFVMARWQPPVGPPVIVVSLRLTPPSTRLDLFRRACWQTHQLRRERHRAQLELLAKAIDQAPIGTPLIVGGDFNSPAGDASHVALRSRVRDGFDVVGCGWGCTFSNGTPFHRIDQIWTSPELEPLRVTAESVQYSDHRAVLCFLPIPTVPDAIGAGRQ